MDKYVLDLLTKQVHEANCDCIDEILPENRHSLGNQRYALEAVLQAQHLGFEDAVCTCEACQKQKDE